MVGHGGAGAPSRSARELFVVCALFALALTVVGLHVRAYPKLSPIDEMQHFDYLEKISRGERVRPGDRIGEAAMREESCRGIDAEFLPPPCTAEELRPEQYQELGYSTAYTQTPVYYLTTGLAARALRAVVGFESLLTAARFLGGVWLGLGLVLLDRLLRQLRAPAVSRVIVPLATVSTPVVLHASATVNPDAVLLPFGAAIVLLVLRAERDRRYVPAAAAVAGFAVFAEPTNLLAVLAAAAFVGVRLLGARRTSGYQLRSLARSSGTVAAVLAAVAVAFLASMLLLRSAGGEDPGLAIPKNESFHREDIGVDVILGELASLVTPVQNAYSPPMLRNVAVITTIRLVNWWLIGALVGAALLRSADRRVPPLAVALGVTMVAGGPLFAAVNAQSDFYFAIPSRYGLPLLGASLAIAGRTLEKRPAQLVAGLVALLGFAGYLSAVLSA